MPPARPQQDASFRHAWRMLCHACACCCMAHRVYHARARSCAPSEPHRRIRGVNKGKISAELGPLPKGGPNRRRGHRRRLLGRGLGDGAEPASGRLRARVGHLRHMGPPESGRGDGILQRAPRGLCVERNAADYSGRLVSFARASRGTRGSTPHATPHMLRLERWARHGETSRI